MSDSLSLPPICEKVRHDFESHMRDTFPRHLTHFIFITVTVILLFFSSLDLFLSLLPPSTIPQELFFKILFFTFCWYALVHEFFYLVQRREYIHVQFYEQGDWISFRGQTFPLTRSGFWESPSPAILCPEPFSATPLQTQLPLFYDSRGRPRAALDITGYITGLPKETPPKEVQTFLLAHIATFLAHHTDEGADHIGSLIQQLLFNEKAQPILKDFQHFKTAALDDSNFQMFHLTHMLMRELSQTTFRVNNTPCRLLHPDLQFKLTAPYTVA